MAVIKAEQRDVESRLSLPAINWAGWMREADVHFGPVGYAKGK